MHSFKFKHSCIHTYYTCTQAHTHTHLKKLKSKKKLEKIFLYFQHVYTYFSDGLAKMPFRVFSSLSVAFCLTRVVKAYIVTSLYVSLRDYNLSVRFLSYVTRPSTILGYREVFLLILFSIILLLSLLYSFHFFRLSSSPLFIINYIILTVSQLYFPFQASLSLTFFFVLFSFFFISSAWQYRRFVNISSAVFKQFTIKTLRLIIANSNHHPAFLSSFFYSYYYTKIVATCCILSHSAISAVVFGVVKFINQK